jgi:hypothetical protein
MSLPCAPAVTDELQLIEQANLRTSTDGDVASIGCEPVAGRAVSFNPAAVGSTDGL